MPGDRCSPVVLRGTPAPLPGSAYSTRKERVVSARTTAPENVKRWPPGHPDDHPKNAPASANEPPSGLSSAPSLTRRPVKGRRRRAARRREAVTCRVSLLFPDEQRTLWHYLARCPVCGRPHLGRARDLSAVTVTRRLPCRHWVTIVVARTYASLDSGPVA